LLRKGRFDEIFFVGLPSKIEREQIFMVHLRNKGQNLPSAALQECILLSEGFSGAEIEEAVITAMYQAFDQDRNLLPADLLDAIKITNPLSKSRAALLREMAEWAQNNAINASKVDKTTEKTAEFASSGRQLQF
jgi:SpoVK/Ycf46/Vps4 family AAA+-type ATPase